MIETPAPPAVETDAAYLRRAAALIRQRAEAVSVIDRGRWHVAEWYDGNFDEDGQTENADLRSRTGAITTQGQLPRPVAELIALLGPPAALALADWLDAEADCQEQCTAAAEGVRDLLAASTGADHRLYVSASTLDQAMNVARIVLGEAT